MNIKIISIRKSDNKLIDALEDDYLKRFHRYARVDLINIRRSQIGGQRFRKNTEFKNIESFVHKADYSVFLTDSGKQFTSEEFSALLERNVHSGKGTMTFFIGGPLGFPPELIQQADCAMSLSRMTMPHKLVRLFLIEALYRAFDIMHDGPYHK